MNPSMHRSRSGAALIIAIIVLAAMLMLGLPFLFSQSSSLAGTRSFAHAQLARVGGATSEDLGAGAGSYVMDAVLRQGSTIEATTLAHLPSITRIGDNRYAFDLSPRGLGFNPGQPSNQSVIGTVLEDESGKLDPNHMDVLAWTRLFAKTGIVDEDDGNGRDRDQDDFKQLAQALAALRFDPELCPEGRITRLDQLLEAKPQPLKPIVRWPLTRAELQQLKPYLTLAPLGQARAGLIDLGTMIKNPQAGNSWDAVLDAEPPLNVLAYPLQRDLFGTGSVIVSAAPNQGPSLPGPNGTTPPRYQYGMSTSSDLRTIPDRTVSGQRNAYPPSHRPRHQEAVGIEIPAPVNIHQTSAEVRHVLLDVPPSVPESPAPHTANGLNGLVLPRPDDLNRRLTGFDLQNPLGVYQSLGETQVSQTRPTDNNHGLPGMPPASDGTLTATATVLHISGGQLDRLPGTAFGRLDGNNGVEYISYSDSYPASGRLDNVRRGLPFPGSMGALVHNAPVTLTIVAPRELPPLAVVSQGMLTIEGGTTVSDAAGRQGAQRFRRIVMQTLPHEELLEARWTRQSHLHTLLVARNGSLMAGFPKATQRRLGEQAGELPDETDAAPDPARPDRSIGARPAVLRTMIGASHLGEHRGNDHRWARRFGIEQRGDNPFEMGEDEYLPSNPPARDNLTPEGVTVTGPISFRLSSPSNAELGFLTRRIRPAAQFDGRSIGMWIKPNAQLTGKSTLLDLRMSGTPGEILPQKLAQFSGAEPTDPRQPGDRFYQNRLNLSYDADTKQLVLTYVNGCIEHLNDYGPVCPSETYAFPTGLPVVDPRCLGTQQAPGATPGLYPLAPKRPLNLVQQRYQLSPTDGLKKDTWYQVQIAMLGNDPGHMAIIVDGIVGREVIRQSTLACDRFGDHFTLPSLRLKTALPASPTVQSGGGSSLLIPRIELEGVAIDPLGNGTQVVTGAAAVPLILPTRGMIRIGNEYISYDELQGGTLLKCMRARRQNSVQLGGNTTWVGLEEHKVDDLVVPGGFRFDPQTGSVLWKGGCSLAEPLPNGDPAPTNPEVMDQPYTVWAELRSDGSALNPANVMVPILRNDTPAGTPIGITITNPAVNTWPRRGYARINQTGEIIYYDNGGPVTSTLNNVQRLQFATMPPPMPPIVWWPVSGTPAPTITLLSFEVNGSPAGNYYNPPDPLPPGWADWHLVQIMDPATGRIEWIKYNHIDVSKGPGFFLDRRGFRFDPLDRRLGPSSRGQQRTAFAPVDLGGTGAMLKFPADSRVIPVQNERVPRQSRAHFISTGDVITIARKSTGAGHQVCVRYAATDGFSLSPGTPPPAGNTASPNHWDTINEFFAFTDALPDNYQVNDFQLMSWPAWSGNDLSPSGRIPVRANNYLSPSTTPWANLMAGEFHLGGDDTGNSFLARGNNQNFDGVIDAVFSINQPGGTLSPNQQSHDDHVAFPRNPPAFQTEWNSGTLRVDQPALAPWIAGPALSDINGVEVFTSAPVFSHQLGLVLIGGEVFAYERQPTQNGSENWHHAKLIGRGLLGSTPTTHSGYEPILTLPIGPVARLIQPLPAGEQEVQISERRDKQRTRGFNAPALAFHSPDPQAPEVEIIGTAHELTAGWLHGMYNTPVKGIWTQIGGLEPLVIGWWPRYPSGMPSQSSQAFSGFKSQILRCRSYSWMGYPLRFRDTYFNRGDALAEVTLLSDGDGMYSVKAMALDQGFDWSQAFDSATTLTAGAGYQDASQAFARFDRKAIDGAELRIVWQYLTAPARPQADRMGEYLAKIAAAGNTAPMLGKVKVRARAPTRVIQVEEAR